MTGMRLGEAEVDALVLLTAAAASPRLRDELVTQVLSRGYEHRLLVAFFVADRVRQFTTGPTGVAGRDRGSDPAEALAAAAVGDVERLWMLLREGLGDGSAREFLTDLVTESLAALAGAGAAPAGTLAAAARFQLS